MQIDKLDTTISHYASHDDIVKVVEMGNITELQFMQKRNKHATIKVLPGMESYVHLSTGEIKDIKHHDTRAEQKKSLLRTFANARALINTNVTDVNKVRWITLTYSENMTDTKRLYDDFKQFNMRFQYWCNKQGFGKAEYIVMMEPQERGAWHAHLLYIWQDKAPFIPNDKLAEIWRYGFVKVKKLDDVDNVGAYLTAYLGDMEINEVQNITDGKLKTVDVLDDNGIKQKKFYIKGARLHLYPKGFKMIRHSKGIKEPAVTYMTYDKAQKKVLGATKTFESAVKLTDNNGFENIIAKEYYNSKRMENQSQ